VTRLLGVLLGLVLLAACGAPTRAAGPAAGPQGGTDLTALRAKADLGACPAAGVRPVAAALPDLVMPCLAGGPDVRLSALGGVPMVINGWASWCQPCRAELPYFERLSGAIVPTRLRVLGIDVEDSDATALDFAAARGVHFPTVVDAKGTFRTRLGMNGVPFTLFVRPDGSLAETHVGPLTYDQLTGLLEAKLGVRVA
jgi:cytochrome c biogenesis protein CcmG, thiol:disulfide interchange protein DsbE